MKKSYNYSRPTAERLRTIGALSLVGVVGTFATVAKADVLYSTIAGASATSAQPAYSSSLNLTGNVNNGGPFGFGDDYTTPYRGLNGAAIKATDNSFAASQLVDTDQYVEISSISYYGDLEPGPNGATTTLRSGKLYSLGASLNFTFYDSAGNRDTAAILHTPAATDNGLNNPATASSYTSPGFHTYSFAPTYVPASGYISLQPVLTSNYNASIGTSTPIGTVPPSLTGYFGNAPTVGTGTAGYFATVTADPNNPNNSGGVLNPNTTFSSLPNPTPASPDADGDAYTYTSSPSGTASSGYLQVEFDGTGLGGATPEPMSASAFGLIALIALGRPSRSKIHKPSN